MSSGESQELTEVASTNRTQSPSDAAIKTHDEALPLELPQPSTSRGFPSDTVYLNIDLHEKELLASPSPRGSEEEPMLKQEPCSRRTDEGDLLLSGESFLSALDPMNDMATSTSVNVERTEAAIITEVDRSGPPPPYYDEPTYVYRDGRYVRVPRAQQVDNYRGPTTQNEQNRRPPPYSSFDPFLLSLFDDKKIRNQFVQKVYVILTLQLLFTFGCIGLCLYNLNVKVFVMRNATALFISGAILYFTLSIVLMCCDAPRRMYPLNVFLLSLFTLAMTMLTATMSCFYDTYIVLAAFGITAGITLTITALSFLPFIDITGMGIYLMIAGLVIIVYGLIACVLAWFGYTILWTIYAWLVTILFCFYLMYDTQLIIGGKRVELSPEEYILGALILYTDIMMIFIYVMEIMKCR